MKMDMDKHSDNCISNDDIFFQVKNRGETNKTCKLKIDVCSGGFTRMLATPEIVCFFVQRFQALQFRQENCKIEITENK